MRTSVKVRLEIFEILIKIYKKNLRFDSFFNSNYIQSSNFSERDRALINNVCLSSMRYKFHVNKIINLFLVKKTKINQYILFLSAITQIVYLNFKQYAVINDTVEVAKKIHVNPGLVNATLKEISKQKTKLEKKIVIGKEDFPYWLQNQITGIEPKLFNNFLRTFHIKPNLHLVFKSENEIKKFNENFIKTTDTSLFLKESKPIQQIHNYNKGDWWVQDLSSMLPLSLVQNLKNKKIIDLCCAPGGKSFQILSRGFNLKMNDINKKRIFILKENLKRLNFNGNIINKDILKFNTHEKYNFVILDAPCSSIGTIRKNPEILFRNNPPDLKKLIDYQYSLILKASKMLSNNGILLYMVCSFLHSETIKQVESFLKKNNNFTVSKFEKKDLNKETKELINDKGYIYIMPKYYKKCLVDGFFAVMLRKNDS